MPTEKMARLRISDFLDIKFGTVDTVLDTAGSIFWSPCAGLTNASGHPTLTGDSSRAQKLDFRTRP